MPVRRYGWWRGHLARNRRRTPQYWQMTANGTAGAAYRLITAAVGDDLEREVSTHG
jgi:hypothetical protein